MRLSFVSKHNPFNRKSAPLCLHWALLKQILSDISGASGFTILCRGEKSDKLELAFEVLDKNKNSRLSHDDMTKFPTIVSHCSFKHRLFAVALQ
jgi:hypothetical protein